MKLFIDIETVRGVDYPTMDDIVHSGFDRKFAYEFKDKLVIEPWNWFDLYRERAGLYAEFGKVCCVSMGFIDPKGELQLKSIAGFDEKELLLELQPILNK
jgi:hypothetical protein